MTDKVGIITVNFNQFEYTVDCINSILGSDFQNFQVALIDNGSREEIKRKLSTKYLDSQKVNLFSLKDNNGYAAGVNNGFRLLQDYSPDYFLIMNNDTIIDSQAIEKLIQASKRHTDNAIVSGKVYNFKPKDHLQYIGQKIDPRGGLNQVSIIKNRNEKDLGQYDFEIELGMLDDIFWLIPKNIYNSVGMYSEDFFMYGEQNDYAFRALEKGFKLIYTHDAKIWHKGGGSTSSNKDLSPRIQYWKNLASFKLAFLHLPRNKYLRFSFFSFIRMLAKQFLLFLIAKRSLNNLRAVYYAKRDFNEWKRGNILKRDYNPFTT